MLPAGDWHHQNLHLTRLYSFLCPSTPEKDFLMLMLFLPCCRTPRTGRGRLIGSSKFFSNECVSRHRQMSYKIRAIYTSSQGAFASRQNCRYTQGCSPHPLFRRKTSGVPQEQQPKLYFQTSRVIGVR